MDENKIKQTIGQLDASIDKAEEYLNNEEFREYCDSIATAITHWRCILKIVREPKTIKENED